MDVESYFQINANLITITLDNIITCPYIEFILKEITHDNPSYNYPGVYGINTANVLEKIIKYQFILEVKLHCNESDFNPEININDLK